MNVMPGVPPGSTVHPQAPVISMTKQTMCDTFDASQRLVIASLTAIRSLPNRKRKI